MSRRILDITRGLCGLALVCALGCKPGEGAKPPSDAEDDAAIGALIASGVVIEGTQDPRSIQKLAEGAVALLPDRLNRRAWADAFGVAQELEALGALGLAEALRDFGFEIVEFVPDQQGSGTDFFRGLTGAWMPKIPRGDSLASNTADAYPLANGGVRVEEHGSSSRGESTQYREYDAGGNTTEEGYRVVLRDGTTQETVVVHNPDGSRRSTHVRRHPNGEKDIIVVKRDAEGNETRTDTRDAQNDKPAGEQPDGDKPVAEDKPPPEKLDKYQPADGTEGAVCPMYLPACRRVAEQVAQDLADPYRLVAGSVRVNPGDPDDQPEAPRLAVDPTDLAVNPDPNVTVGPRGAAPRGLRVAIPVFVLPPKPNDDDDVPQP